MIGEWIRKIQAPLRRLFSDRFKGVTGGDLTEIGFAGTGSSSAGGIVDEHLPDISFPKSILLYGKMRRSDATIQALEFALTLPIRATDWRMEKGGSSPTAQEATELMTETFFAGMTVTFDDFLRESLLALFYGFVPFEKVYEERRGYLTFRKLAARHPMTVETFLFDPQGGLAGLIQSGVDPTGQWRRVIIPIEKLLVFIWRKEFGNPYGFSLLRPIYKHWTLKDLYYRLHSIALERWSAGIAVGKVPAGTPQGDRNLLLNLLERVRTHEHSALVIPEGFVVDILGGQVGSAQAFIDAVHHHDTMIVKGVLAQFLNLGQGQVGSWALSRDHSQLFLLSLNAVARWFCDTVNRYAIVPLCQMNFGNRFNEFPRLTFTDLRMVLHRDELVKAIADLVARSVLTRDEELENWVRELIDLPRKKGSPGPVGVGRNGSGDDKPADFPLARVALTGRGDR